jgi:hypothetical protein
MSGVPLGAWGFALAAAQKDIVDEVFGESSVCKMKTRTVMQQQSA